MSNFESEVLKQLKEISTKLTNLENEIQEVKKVVIRTEEQTKENTEFITAIKQIAKQ